MTTVITTYLEMTSPAQFKPKWGEDKRFRVMEATVKQWQFNRFLYTLVGDDWKWRDKLTWNEDQWKSCVENDALRTFVAYYDGSPAGFFELFMRDKDVQIVYFGLTPRFIGRGFGGPLLSHAICEAWKMDPARVWVHTCDRDHPAALRNYEARGMEVYCSETTDEQDS